MKYIDDDIVSDLYFGHMKPEELPEWVVWSLREKSEMELILKSGQEMWWESQRTLDNMSKCLLLSSVENGLVTLDELPKLARNAMAEVVLPSDEELQKYFDDSVTSANKDYVSYMFMVSTSPSGRDGYLDTNGEWQYELYNSCIYFNRQYVKECYVARSDDDYIRIACQYKPFKVGEGFSIPIQLP